MKKSGEGSHGFLELRRQAENLLRENSEGLAGTQDQDVLRLIHELEVHEVELQLQNDELREASRELEEARNQYLELYESAPVGYLTTDLKGIILRANLKAANMLGLRESHLERSALYRFIYPTDKQKYFNFISRSAAHGHSGDSCELKMISANGLIIHVRAEAVAVRDYSGRYASLRIVIVDITDRVMAEEALEKAHAELKTANLTLRESERQLRHLASRLLTVQEEEKKRIARELHDSIGQTLAAIKFSVEHALRENVNEVNAEAAFNLLENLVPTIRNAIDETRNIYMGLRPSMLDSLGLVATINWFCREFRKTCPQNCVELKIDIQEEDIPEELKIVIFRVMQEALNNAFKHSVAGTIHVSLVKTGEAIRMTIEDNGAGFDVDLVHSSTDPNRGMGLSSMRERTELSGGAFNIESTVGKGTAIMASWPLNRS